MRLTKYIRSGPAGGFTLMELLITMAIVGILAAVAYPSYTQYILKSHRADAQAILLENAQFMERYFTTNNTYAGGTVLSLIEPKSASGSTIRYNFRFSVTPTSALYTLQAVPANGQTSDQCGTMTISNTGAQTAAVSSCW